MFLGLIRKLDINLRPPYYPGILGLQSLDLEDEASGGRAAVCLVIRHLFPQPRHFLLQVTANV